MNEDERRVLNAKLSIAFRPAAPIDSTDLFAGRKAQMQDVIDVVFQPGQHAVVYGERGVGKTSLTTVMTEALGGGSFLALRSNCDGTDTFSSIWHKVLNEVRIAEEVAGAGFKPEVRQVMRSAAELLPEDGQVTPNDVRRILQPLGKVQTTVVFFDEFDRIEDQAARALFADTIKTLSDQLVPATIILVGVADSVDELIAEHRSVERAMVQIHMPRMSQEELAEIVHRGMTMVGMTIDPKAVRRITRLSQGLPHYTHLLSQYTARVAIEHDRLNVDFSDVQAAITKALERAQESIINAYHKATTSPRENLYEQVLCACALAPTDDLGFFAAADVRAPLSAIMGKRYDIPAFARHLDALSDGGRGPVLQKSGVARKYRFRFLNPLLQPYVMMRGLASNVMDDRTIETFAS